MSSSRADKTKLGKQKPDKRLLFMREVLTRKRHEEASQGAVHVLDQDIEHVGVVAAAAAAKSLQSCPTLCDPIDGSPPGSLSLGFSRREHWSGLPFPSPMRESEKWKWSHSVMSNSSRPRGLQPTRILCPWDFPGKSTGVGCHCLLHWVWLHGYKNYVCFIFGYFIYTL